MNEVVHEEPAVPPLTRTEMNAILEAEGLEVRVREEAIEVEETTAPKSRPHTGNAQIASLLRSQTKQKTVTNLHKDRSLSGKARRKARRGN